VFPYYLVVSLGVHLFCYATCYICLFVLYSLCYYDLIFSCFSSCSSVLVAFSKSCIDIQFNLYAKSCVICGVIDLFRNFHSIQLFVSKLDFPETINVDSVISHSGHSAWYFKCVAHAFWPFMLICWVRFQDQHLNWKLFLEF